MTQRGVRKDFQTLLASRGVEVVEFDFLTPRAVMEFDFLTPRAVMEYCYHRGFLSVLWECGGMLSAPAISSGVIHKVLPSSLFLCSDLYLHGDDDDKVLINLNK
jgi:diaminohydroxyphosphoribosylaminopyrimidine deaminase/5-amino-6-(5-phosphoribosylamino)uracil reductase